MNRKELTHKGIKLSYLDNEKESPRTLLFSHANGYSGACYGYYLRRLGEKYRVVAPDLINHGASGFDIDFSSWDFYVEQIISVISQENLNHITGIGHSMGGSLLIRAAYEQAEKFDCIIGLDPTMLNLFKIVYSRLFGNPLSKISLRRKNSFKNKKLLERIFKKHPLTKDWHSEILKDYIDSCFKEENGKIVLSCDPRAESKNFRTPEYKTIRRARASRTLTHFILPRNSEVYSSKMAMKTIGKHPDSKFILKEGIRHHFPFEEPEWTLAEIEKILTR